jgi:hypothetical protein
MRRNGHKGIASVGEAPPTLHPALQDLPETSAIRHRGQGSPAQVAAKIAGIIEERKPRFQYNLSTDAKLISSVVTRLLPFRVRAAMNRRMYRLGNPMAWSEPTAASETMAPG